MVDTKLKFYRYMTGGTIFAWGAGMLGGIWSKADNTSFDWVSYLIPMLACMAIATYSNYRASKIFEAICNAVDESDD